MKKYLLLIFALIVGASAFSQSVNWYDTSDGTVPEWGDWAYKDVLIPAGMQVDSVFGAFQRPGYSADAHDFIFSYNLGSVYDGGTAGGPWDYLAETNSLYGYWIDLTSFNYEGQGVVRIGLPTPAGAIWDSVGIATSPISGASIVEISSIQLAVYPNPSRQSITIKSESLEPFEITDLLGNTILTEDKAQETKVIEVSGLPSGTYFIRQEQSVIKFIKN